MSMWKVLQQRSPKMSPFIAWGGYLSRPDVPEIAYMLHIQDKLADKLCLCCQ